MTMREMKFRAWDNVAKEYIDNRYVSIDGLGLLHVDKHIIKNCFRPPHTRKNPWFIVEQFTGLKDKNGTEIYEGDIIQFEFWNEKYYRQIAYNSAIASYEAITVTSPTSKKLRQKAKYSFSELYKISSKGFKVVGNIHENPELLEEK